MTDRSPPPDLPHELQLVLGARDGALVGDLVDRVDWDLAYRLARYHRAAGTLADTLVRADLVRELPPDVADALVGESRRQGAWFHTRVAPQLAELVTALGSAGVVPVVLKGGALVLRGWRAPSARPMADLDLLVARADIDAAAEVLRALGYGHDAPLEIRRWARAHHYQDPVYVHSRHPLPVELHWHVQHPRHRRGFPVEALRTEQVTVDGVGYTVLETAEQLAHLGRHFWDDRCKVHAGAIGQLHDVDAVARRMPEAGWPRLAADARGRGHHDVVAAALATAGLLIGTPSPPGWPAVRRLRSDDRLISFAYRRVLAPRPEAVQMLMVTPDVPYRPSRLARRVAAQLRSSPVAAVGDHEHRRRVARSLLALARHPLDARSELSLDRWAHDLA